MNFKHFDIISKDTEDLQMIKQIMVMEIIISGMLLFVGIAALITIHMCIVGRAFRRGLGSDSSADGALLRSNVPTIRGIGMTPQDLKKLPCFEYNKEAWDKGTGPTTDCPVCLENFKVGDKCRVLPNCHHCFHAHCVDLWLVKTPFCPVCRTSAKASPIIHSNISQGSNTPSNNTGNELL